MEFILIVSFIFIAAVGISNHEQVIRSIRSGSINLRIGIFTLIVGIILIFSGKILGFEKLSLINDIISICFLITFLCLIIGIFKFIRLTPFSFNRKMGIFCLIVGFTLAFTGNYFSILTTLIASRAHFQMITSAFYIVAVLSLIVEVFKFIFGSKSKEEKLN